MAHFSAPKAAPHIAIVNIYLGSFYALFKDYFRDLGYGIG
jgi:hypothetical protein